MSESSEKSVDGEPIVEKSNSSKIVEESSDSSHHPSPNSQEQADTPTDSTDHSSPSKAHNSPSTSQNQESSARSSECENGDVRAISPESVESVTSSVRMEDVVLREKSSSDEDRPKPHPPSIDTSDSEASASPYSPGLYTSGNLCLRVYCMCAQSILFSECLYHVDVDKSATFMCMLSRGVHNKRESERE